MQGGLASTDGDMHITTTAASSTGANASGLAGGNSNQATADFASDVDVDAASIDSHLDSFFSGSGWTREDIMVVAAGIQILMWTALLYLEVQK
ncbi:hypothetical protein [Salarchaeum japonicum]|uniref:Uncharacterized protein n=1 Tax=Salarchaeum japonicum TaxID=555573 RepID=A0AAV3T012_9EURY|nr:hypothetical protein [Salarchaeum japonicum]